MEYDLNQWRNNNHSHHHQFEHEQQQQQQQQPSTKIQRLLLDEGLGSSQHIHQNGSSGGSETALPLFVPEPNRSISNHSCSSNLSAFPDSLTTTTYRFPRIGGLFSLAQWQELELQALIFKYMLAGAPVPPELLQSINKSFLNTPACCLHYTQQQQQQHYQHFQPALLQSGYWGRGSMDPEPGRCRRTDGKKWRCSRDVVPGQKYCERHVHRGRNRSRKPGEIPTPASAGGGSQKTTNPVATAAATSSKLSVMTSGNNFSSPSIELLHINQRSSENKLGHGFFQETHNQRISLNEKPDGQILRHFFDDWPRSNQESNGVGNNASPATSTTCLSISTPGNPSSDFSLKLSTGGNVDEHESQQGNAGGDRPQMNWGAMAWGGHQVSSMGGPLAEALRSSTTNSSPTSVLHELRRGSLSAETSSVST